MKTKRSDKVISQFAGAIPIYNRIKGFGLDKVIRETLGERPYQAKYQYDEVLIGWIMTMLTQEDGFRLIKMEDAKKDLASIPGLNLCSHDTIGRVLKKFATENEIYEHVNEKHPKDGVKTYKINENNALNELLVLSAVKMGLLKQGISYLLDIDVTIIPSKTREAERTYKGMRGFSPMVCMINKIPVYISMRNGKASADLRKSDCIEKCLELLKKHGINVGRVRIDGAGYSKEVTSYLKSKNLEFVIGADWSEKIYSDVLGYCEDWKKCEFVTFSHKWNAQLGSIPYSLSRDKNIYRVVVIRVKEQPREEEGNRNKPKWRLQNGWYYKFVLTNDLEAEPEAILKEYHLRGASERNFDYLKNDFGWRILPFSKLNENLVHMVISALANNVYHALLNIFSKSVEKIKLTFRLARFIKEFIQGQFSIEDDEITFYKSEIDYSRLME